MTDNPLFYTAAMAKLCAGQGYVERSMEIFRHLLKADPDNQVLRQALAEVEAKQTVDAEVSAAAAGQADRLAPMIKKWVELTVEHDLKSKFDKIRRNVRLSPSSRQE